jgi:hypothetical protein
MPTLPKLRILLLVLIYLFALVAIYNVKVQASPTTWIIETVDASTDVGSSSSIAIDPDDFPHIAYYDWHWQNLKYATPSRIGPGWVILPLDTVGNVGEGPSIAFGSTGGPHISYYERGLDPTNVTIKHVAWNGTAYVTEKIDNSYAGVGGTSIALDSSDNPRISYYGGPYLGDLKYASWDGAIWSIETVDSTETTGMASSLKLDSNGFPHISYLNSTGGPQLNYAYWTGATWSIEAISGTNNVLGPSLVLDSNDYPCISYHDDLSNDLEYVRWNGTAWSFETVDSGLDVGLFSSLALDWLDRPHIAYYDRHWENLKYARWFGGEWIIEVVDHVGDVGWAPSLALDSEGKPHISYYDSDAGNLKYASNPNEYFAGVNTIVFDSDSDGNDDSVRFQMNVDTMDVHGAYSGTVPIRVNAFLVDSLGYHADYNSSGWSITGDVVDWMHPNATITLSVPAGYVEGPATYSVEINLFDEDDFYEDFYHETGLYLYPASTPEAPIVKSCDASGVQQDVFELGETVSARGMGFAQLTSYPFYIVENREAWTDGMTIPERVPGTSASIVSNEDGNIDPSDVWHDPQILGGFDIIVDVNSNGQYDEGVDALDDDDIELVAGFVIIPEFAVILPGFIIATLAMAVLLKRKYAH